MLELLFGAAQETVRSILAIIGLFFVIPGLIQCFFGYRVLKLFAAFMGFLAGLVSFGIIGMSTLEAVGPGLLTGLVGGLLLALLAFNLTSWTLGVLIMGGRAAFSLRRAVLNPGVVGIGLGLLCFLSGLRFPSPVGASLSFLSDLNTPLAMVVIGTQLAEADLPNTFRQPRNYLVSFLRLALFPTLTALLLLPLRSSSGLYCALVLLSATPVAGTTSLFAQQFGRDTAPAAESITLSTLLSILTLPPLRRAGQRDQHVLTVSADAAAPDGAAAFLFAQKAHVPKPLHSFAGAPVH